MIEKRFYRISQWVKNQKTVLVSAVFCNMLTHSWTLNPSLQKKYETW